MFGSSGRRIWRLGAVVVSLVVLPAVVGSLGLWLLSVVVGGGGGPVQAFSGLGMSASSRLTDLCLLQWSFMAF